MISHTTKRRAVTVLTAAAVSATLSACGSNPLKWSDYHRVDSLAEAGSTHVSIQMVAPWEEYVEEMSADFPMDESTALAKVLPTTLTITRKQLNASKFGLKLAPPTSGTTGTIKTDIGEDGKETTTSNDEQSKNPGDLSGVTAGDAGIGGRTVGGLTGFDLSKEKVAIDPVLQHQVALALKQEVALLNRQVSDAALRDGMAPYLVRMQVSVLPNARLQPYNVNLDASFFYANSDDPKYKTPTILPMLVTDNLEAALQSRSVDFLRQQVLALGILHKGFAAGFDFGKFNEQFESVFGRDMNSLMTVARASDNTMRVRLGAQYGAGQRYSMTTRTHNVSFVVLADRQYQQDMASSNRTPTMKLVTRTDMIDAEHGTKLAVRTQSDIDQAFQLVTDRFGFTKVGQEDLNALLVKVQKNQYAEFVAQAKKLGIELFHESLWASLVEIMDGSSLKSASFDLRPPRRMTIDSQQSLLLVDDGKKLEVSLRGSSLVAKKLKATLDYDGYQVPSSHLAVTGDMLQLRFPSPVKWGVVTGVKDNVPVSCNANVEITVSQRDDLWSTTVRAGAAAPSPQKWSFSVKKPSSGVNENKCRYLKTAEPKAASPTPATKPQFSVATAVSSLLSSKGAGSLKLSVEIAKNKAGSPATEVVLSVKNADVDSATGTGVTAEPGNKIRVSQSSDVVLKLSRLVPGAKVTVSSKDKADKPGTSLELPVIPVG